MYPAGMTVVLALSVMLQLLVLPGAVGIPARPPPFRALRTLPDAPERGTRPKPEVRRSADTEGARRAGVESVQPTHLRDSEEQTRRFLGRAKRAPQQGCVLGTCQIHNLANTLYQIGKGTGKDESHRASDPHGYGR
ncbi:protein ADM2-like [Scleropages formosus]|nr:protein ADM2-like [Scleropages formosus]